MTKFTILGCGSSLGSPRITNNWGKLNKKNKFNIRTRCSAHIKKGEILSGKIMDPIKNEILYAEKNTGAFFNNQRIRVSKKNIIDDCLFVTNSEGVKFKNITENQCTKNCAFLNILVRENK